jgi:alkaline phosphatase
MKHLFLFLLSGLSSFAQKVHSHNDYLQVFPLKTALAAKVASVEADVFLQSDKLLVAHTEAEIREANTLEKLYFKPLSARKRGSSYPVVLLIDVKTEAVTTLDAIIKALEKYPKIINSKSGIKIVISGNRPKDFESYPNYIFFDLQEIDKLNEPISPKVGMISFSFKQFSNSDLKSALSSSEVDVLKGIIEKAHKLNQQIRFWATPDHEAAWQQLHALGVDFINTDQPRACVVFFKGKSKS